MEVIKRDGRVQQFDMNKIMITIERASDEANTPMNDSDINIVTGAIKYMVKTENADRISVENIQNIVINSLNSNGFNSVAKYYSNYKK